jgi:hypothetical protein
MDAYETLKDAAKREEYHRLWDVEVKKKTEEERKSEEEKRRAGKGRVGRFIEMA